MSTADHVHPPTGVTPMTNAAKRALDLVGALVGLMALSPLLITAAIAIKLESPGPIFFRQSRVGRNGRLFRILKFRTMFVSPNVPVERAGPALTVRDDKRITCVGAFLRKTKIDELPQFINVLVGDMSLVGPRPEVPEFMAFYSPSQQAVVTSMRPGITDYASILFRDESQLFEQGRDPIAIYRFEILPIKYSYYERYSREIGTFNDLRIIFATILLVVLDRVPKWLGIEYLLRHKYAQQTEPAIKSRLTNPRTDPVIEPHPSPMTADPQ